MANRERPKKLFIELTPAGDELKDIAAEVPCEMEGCLKLDADELMELKKLLDKAIMQMDEDICTGSGRR